MRATIYVFLELNFILTWELIYSDLFNIVQEMKGLWIVFYVKWKEKENSEYGCAVLIGINKK